MPKNSKLLFCGFTIICSSSKALLQQRSCLPSNVSRAEKKFRTRLNSEVFARKTDLGKPVKLQYLEFSPETDEYDDDPVFILHGLLGQNVISLPWGAL